MMTRPITGGMTYLGSGEADQLARQFAGTEQPGIPQVTYLSSPGAVTMTTNCAYPGGGYGHGSYGTAPEAPPTAWRTW